MATTNERKFTGWHATAWLVCFFGVVVTVNMVMARYASSTFGGVVVQNSYVASQHFNGWLDQAEQQKQLGWSASASRTADDRVTVVLAGAPEGAVLSGEARHPLGRYADRPLHFAVGADGRYISSEPLPADRWTLRLEVQAGTDRWRSEEDFR